MARIALCIGTTDGLCVTVLNGGGDYTAPTGYFIPPDSTGEIGDTWSGSAWLRADPHAPDVVTASSWGVDHSSGELYAAQDGNRPFALAPDGVALFNHTQAKSVDGTSPWVQHASTGNAPALGLFHFADTAEHSSGLSFARSRGADFDTKVALSSTEILGRFEVYGTTLDEAVAVYTKTSDMIWRRQSGGADATDPLLSTLEIRTQKHGTVGLSSALFFDPSGKVGVNTANPSAMLTVRAVAPPGDDEPPNLLAALSPGGTVVFSITDVGGFVSGHSSAVAVPSGEVAALQVHTTADTAPMSTLHGHWSNDATGAEIRLAKSRSTAPGTRVAVSAGDNLGGIAWYKAGSDDFDRAGSLQVSAGTTDTNFAKLDLLMLVDSEIMPVLTYEAGQFGFNVDIAEAGVLSEVASVFVAEAATSKPASVLALRHKLSAGETLAVDGADVDGHGAGILFESADENADVVPAVYIGTVATDDTPGVDSHAFVIRPRSTGTSNNYAREFRVLPGGHIVLVKGNVSEPSISFAGVIGNKDEHRNSGLYWDSATAGPAIAYGGVRALGFRTNGGLFPNGTAAQPGVSFVQHTGHGLFAPNAAILQLCVGGEGVVNILTTSIRPVTDNSLALGAGSLRYTTVFATTGTINTSDQREKEDLGTFPLGLAFVESLQPRYFKWTDGTRSHLGLYAQEVAKALEGADISPSEAGIWTMDDPADPESRQGLRMDQFISVLISAVKDLKQQLDTLRAEVLPA